MDDNRTNPPLNYGAPDDDLASRTVTAGYIGRFRQNQPVYAAHGIPTFPVRQDKIPAISNWPNLGRRGSSELARKPRFRKADAFGYPLGRKTRITDIDIDARSDASRRDRNALRPDAGRNPVAQRHARPLSP